MEVERSKEFSQLVFYCINPEYLSVNKYKHFKTSIQQVVHTVMTVITPPPHIHQTPDSEQSSSGTIKRLLKSV